MWNESKSLKLSLFCTRLFLSLLTVVVMTAPFLVGWYFGDAPQWQTLHKAFLGTVYGCCVPAFLLLGSLHKLLENLGRGVVFEQQNPRLLRIISWCCVVIGLMTLFSGFFYLPFLLLAVACAFFGLIIRVIKNVFEQAMALKEENDFTI